MTRRNPPIPEPPSPPDLPTLDVKATWHNRAGRVDRSCCFVLTAASLWRQLPDECWRHTQHVDAVSAKRLISGQSTGPRRFPDRVGSLALSARDLWHYHRFEKPSPLRGDFRTTKANAFKPAADATRWWKEVSAHEADASRPSSSAAASHAGEPPANQATPGRGPAAIHTRGDTSAARQKKRPSKLPPGRVTKLFLPLCTPREWEDAQLAHLWLATHTNPNRPHTPGTLRLINRYAELFPGRQLRCRQCLGLRYGEVKGLK